MMIQCLHNQIFNLHRGFSLGGGGVGGEIICLEYRRDTKNLMLLIMWHLLQYGRRGRPLEKNPAGFLIEFGAEETCKANNPDVNGLKPISAII